MDANELALDLDPNFEPQTRARSNTWPLRPNRELDPQNSPVSIDDPAHANLTPEQQANIKDPLGLTAKKSGSRRNAWGNLSYADLITKAILSSPEKRLTLSQIYDWMVQNVPYFQDKGDSTSSAGWKNSIRHNLSLHSRFMRIQNEGTGKSSWWVINPDAKPGKTPRRRAGSMETKSYEKKRGRVRKKVEALRASLENGGTLSPGGSEDYLDALSFGDFRPRASSNASSCGRLSPIHAAAEPDLHDNQVPPMSPIPWGAEVKHSPTLFPGDCYSDLVDSLGDGMKLSNAENLNLVTGIHDPYLSGSPHDFNNQGQNFLGVDPQTSGMDSPYSHLPAPPSYPKQQAQTSPLQQQQQPQSQVNNLEFRQSFNNSGLRLQCRSSPVNKSPGSYTQSDIFGESLPDYNESVLNIKQEPDVLYLNQEADSLSPGSLASPNTLSVSTQPLNSPDRSQQGSPSSGSFNAHMSPQPQAGLLNGGRQILSPLNCQLSPQQTHCHSPQSNIPSVSLQQQQQQQQVLQQQATQASILREALTRGPMSFRSPTTAITSSPNFAPRGNLSPVSSVMSPNSINTGMVGMNNLNINSNSPLHNAMTTGQQIRGMCENNAYQGGQIGIQQAGINTGSSSVSLSGMPLDIDMDLITSLDYDMDQVIKQELSLEGSLDFNFDTAPSSTAGQNVVH